jgi:hypothetical protein
MTITDRVEKWVRRVLTDAVLLRTDTDAPRKCFMLALMHVTGGIKSEVQTLKLGSKQWEPKQLADMFNSIADEHSQGLAQSESGSGQEAYHLVAFYDDQPDLPQCPLPLMRRTGPMVHADDPIVTEAPTAKGDLAMSMRHKDAWQAFTLEMVARTFSAQTSIIDRMAMRMQSLEKENLDVLELAKEQILKEAADAHAHQMTELEYKRKTEERARIMAVAPPLLNQVFGKEIFPTSTADSSLIESLMSNLDESTIGKLTELLIPKLPPETAALLMARFTEVVEKQNAKKAAETAMVRTNGNGKAS